MIDEKYDDVTLEWFEKLVSEKWEPDTALFIRNYCDDKTIFLDIGASNGIFTLYAANLAKTVHAFEPLTKMYKHLKKNVGLNARLKKKIKIFQIAISDHDIDIIDTEPIESNVLSSITHRYRNQFANKLTVVSLANIISALELGKNNKLVIKMDIEGAEYRILSNSNTIRALVDSKSVLLCAFHPGFSHPIKLSYIKIIRTSRRLYYWLMNIFELYKIIKVLPDNILIRRTNEVPLNSKWSLIFLVLGGYYEFILDFSGGKD